MPQKSFVSEGIFTVISLWEQTKIRTLDSGENIVVPAEVHIIIPSRVIEQYRIYCAQTGFESVGDILLNGIIEVCAASAQKSLPCLDDTTAEGIEAMEAMKRWYVTTLI